MPCTRAALPEDSREPLATAVGRAYFPGVSDYANWTEANLRQLIADRIAESSELEFKRSDALPSDPAQRQGAAKEISKDVSAIANTNGGVLIYGIKANAKTNEAEELDAGVDLKVVQPDWLQQIISSHISPQVNVQIRSIPLVSAGAGRHALLLEIQRSLRGAQASDKRYYRRRNCLNDMLDDWEVRELLNRSSHPLVSARVGFKRWQKDQAEHRYYLTFEVVNDGFKAAQHVMVQLEMPVDIHLSDNITSINRPPQPNGFLVENATDPKTNFRRWQFRAQHPVFPQQAISLLNDTVHNQLGYKITSELHRRLREPEMVIRWVVYADDMVPKHGEIRVQALQES